MRLFEADRAFAELVNMIKVVESECWGERRKLLSEAGIETSAATNPGERKRKETDREREK